LTRPKCLLKKTIAPILKKHFLSLQTSILPWESLNFCQAYRTAIRRRNLVSFSPEIISFEGKNFGTHVSTSCFFLSKLKSHLTWGAKFLQFRTILTLNLRIFFNFDPNSKPQKVEVHLVTNSLLPNIWGSRPENRPEISGQTKKFFHFQSFWFPALMNSM